MIRLRLLGTPALAREGRPVTGRAAQRHRLALLALLALAPGRRLSRDKLIATLWPDSDAERGRNLLKVATYVLRSALGDDALVSGGDELGLDTRLEVDVADFEQAIECGDHAGAVALYPAPFMDGFFLGDAPDFERWVDGERARLAGAFGRALEALADAAELARDFPVAAEWWKRRAAQDPFDSRVAVRLMQALEGAGNRAGALQHASIHQRLLEAEFGVSAAPELVAFAERLRSRPRSTSPAMQDGSVANGHIGHGHIGHGHIGHGHIGHVHIGHVHIGQGHAVHGHAAQGSAVQANALVSDTPVARVVACATGEPGPPTGSTCVPNTTAVEAACCAPDATPVVGRQARRLAAGAALLVVALAALGARAVRPASGDPPSIAVLPFVDLSADPDREYFSDGLTEELIVRLAAVPELKVISRTSAMYYKGTRKPLREIARELDVTHVLEGSVRMDGEHVRVSAQLVDARLDAPVWAQHYRYDLRDAFQVQAELANEVAGALELELQSRVRRLLASRRTHDPRAQELFERGRHAWNDRSREAHERAIDYFEQAIARDPDYADAHAGLAHAYLTGYQLGSLPLSEAEAYDRVKWASERALALDEESADARLSFAIALQWQRNWPGAAREFRRAIELNPGHPMARSWYSLLLRGMGRGEEALRESRRAVELDPLGIVSNHNYALQCYHARDQACAADRFRRTLSLAPYPAAHRTLGIVLARQGSTEDAVAHARQAVALAPQRADFVADLAYVLAVAGRADEARRALAGITAPDVEPYNVGRAWVALGEPDSAFAWLERANWRWPHRASRDDPALDPLRAEPRFAALSARIDRQMGVRRCAPSTPAASCS